MFRETSSTRLNNHLLRRLIFVALFVTASLFIKPLYANAASWNVGNASELYTALDGIDKGTGGYASGDTIVLTADITCGWNIVLNGKAVTFDLNGFTLTNTGGINASNGGVVSTTGAGAFNLNLPSYAWAYADGAGSSLTVSNITSSGRGANASNGGTFIVNGDITLNSAEAGASVGTGAGTITVNGDVNVTGDNCTGVLVNTSTAGTEITVNGSITVTGSNTTGVLISGAASMVSVTGDITAGATGAKINTSSSGSTITVGGNVTSTQTGDQGRGASIGFGSNHTITIGGDVAVASSGGSAWGVLVVGTIGSKIDVAGSVFMTGDSGTGAYASGNGGSNTQITIRGDIDAFWKSPLIQSSNTTGIEVSDATISVTVLGNIDATGCGVEATNGGSADITGSVEVRPPADSYSYSAVYCQGGTVDIGGDLLITRDGSTSSIYGISLSNSGTVTVTGNVSAVSSAGSADGIYLYLGGTANVGGDVSATGAGTNTVTGIWSAGGSVTVDGTVSAGGGSRNIGILASGGGTLTFNKAISASIYINTYTPSEVTFNVGSGTLNGGYYDYACANGTTVRVKAWSLTMAAGTGGTALISATGLASGSYEVGAPVALLARDTVPGYDFDRWTSSAGGSFTDLNSPTAVFTMPAGATTVTAGFKTVSTYAIDTSGISGGTVAAAPSSGEEGETVTLTVTPALGKLFLAGSLKYSWGGTDYPLAPLNGSATFVMPASDVTVSAGFEDITVPTVTTATLPAGTRTLEYSQTLSHASNAPATWSITSGALPDGLSLSSGGAIAGTPSAAGTFSFAVQAANAGGSDTQDLTLAVNPTEPVITTAALPAGTEDSLYSFVLEATGIPDIYWYLQAGTLPPGLSLQWTGEVYGMPDPEISADTVYTFTVAAYQYNDYYEPVNTVTKEFTLTLHPAPEYALTFTAPANGSITTGTNRNYEQDAVIPVTASPASGFLFSGWTSSADGTFADPASASTTFTMPGNATEVTASFVIGYDVQVPSIPGGKITASPTLAAEGQTVTLTVTPDLGMQLADGSLHYTYGDADYPLAPFEGTASFAMPASDISVSAVFEAKPPIAVATASELYDALDSFNDGDTIKLNADITYTDAVVVDGLSLILDLNGYTLTVQYWNDYWSAAVYVYNGGSLRTSGAGALNILSTEDGVNAYNESTVAITGNVATVADYCDGVYSYHSDVTVSGNVLATGDWTNAIALDGPGTVTVDGEVSGECDIYSYGYHESYDDWVEEYFSIGEGTLNASTGYYVYANGDATVRIKGWDLTVSAGRGGIIPSGVSGRHEAGLLIPVAASARTGYTFRDWSATGGSLDDTTNPSTTFTMPAGPAALTASFSVNDPPPDDFSEFTVDAAAGTAEIYVDVHSLPGREGDTVNVFYVLYKNGRMVGLEARSPVLDPDGFDDRVTVSFDPAKAPDTWKVFVLNPGGCDPAMPNL